MGGIWQRGWLGIRGSSQKGRDAVEYRPAACPLLGPSSLVEYEAGWPGTAAHVHARGPPRHPCRGPVPCPDVRAGRDFGTRTRRFRTARAPRMWLGGRRCWSSSLSRALRRPPTRWALVPGLGGR